MPSFRSMVNLGTPAKGGVGPDAGRRRGEPHHAEGMRIYTVTLQPKKMRQFVYLARSGRQRSVTSFAGGVSIGEL